MAARPHVSAGIARQIWIAALALFSSALVGTASAYEQITHMVLSQQAFYASSMYLISFEHDIGAFGINNDGSLAFEQYPATTGVDWNMFALLQVGAIKEDDGLRPMNHFFNPVNDAPLAVPVLPTYTSPAWALAPVGSIMSLAVKQTNSFEDARQYYWTALTASDPKVRSQNFGLLYQSLGQVIHHLQDMAQPQHARDEAHCDAYWACGVIGGAFGYYHPSAYELYMLYCTIRAANDGPVGTCPPLSGSYPVVFDQNNKSTSSRFKAPRDFWTESPAGTGNGGKPSYGIAEYTNAGFVGARTNFQGTPQAILPADNTNLPLPNGIGAVPSPEPITSIAMLGPLFPITATMTFISTPVNDQYTNTTTTNPRTSAYSIFTSDLWPIHFNAVFSLNELTYSSAAAMLIPRAIGYSAGLLNYFFRGQIGISLPHEGVYGIVDQADQYSANYTTDVSGNTQGFHVIKVALTNASPDGEAMTNGTLAAVLRYRRNRNYVDTLTGEAGASGSGNLAGARGPSDEYVVAATVKDAAGNVVSPGQVQLTGSRQEFEFDFPNALPLNSTDVYLQVAWKGELGQPGQPDSDQEPGAVVSSTVDLSEPTYINIFNSLDYISIAGKYVKRDELNGDQNLLNLVQPQSCVDRQTSPATLYARCFSNTESIPIYLDALNISPDSKSLISLQQLPVGTYARVAVLTNAFGPNASVTLNNASTCNIGSPAFTVNALDNEMAITSPTSATFQSTVQETADVSTLESFRGILGWLNYYCTWDGDGSTQAPEDTSKMAVLSGNDIYPFPVKINFPEGPPPG